MYLKKSTSKKTGRTNLSIVHGFRDENGKVRQKTIKSLGYLDVLEKDHKNPIAHFEKVVKKMNEEYKESNKPITLELNMNEELDINTSKIKSLGYLALSSIYHELEIDKFITPRSQYSKAEYNHNSIFRSLVYSRLISPGSKRNAFMNKDYYFDSSEFELEDVYRSLPFFNKYKDDMMLWIHEQLTSKYQRDTSLMYYDVTNYYFEIDEQDELRRKGISKEHKPSPIVQMGLFMDRNGLPVSYGLFPGNTNDSTTLIPMIDTVQDTFNMGKIIIVADKGVTCGDNIGQILMEKNGYVLSYSIRGATKEFKDFVLDKDGYKSIKNPDSDDDKSVFKIKSRIYPREITVTDISGKKKKVVIDEKQVVYYSEKYAKKARKDRAEALNKAQDMVDNPEKYTQSKNYGAAKYVKDTKVDKETGEIKTKKNQVSVLQFDEEKLKEDEKYDGYYAIVTSELDEKDLEIVDIYRGLWKIEESFKVTKTGFSTRPIHLSREDHIEAHFLICFISLLLARMLEFRLNKKYSAFQIIESLRNSTCSLIKENIFLNNYCDKLLEDIGNELDINFKKSYFTRAEIKKYLAVSKKAKKHNKKS